MTAQGPAHRVHATDQQDWAGLLNEIAARLHGMRESARESDQELLPPLLILGTSERVGSATNDGPAQRAVPPAACP
jgi:hypothetical protein